MVDTNTAVANINQVELMARLEPEQQMQLLQIQQEIIFDAQRRQAALELENYRSNNALMLADKEHQNKFVQMQYQANREDQREAMKEQAAVTLADKKHEHQLDRMPVEQQNLMALAEFNTGLSVITTLMEENGKVHTSMLARMDNSHRVRDEVFKIHAGAVIQEILAQYQHQRELEKMQVASSLKQSEQSEQYFKSICLRISKLLDDSQDEKVKQEIAELHEMWTKGENKDN